MKLWVVEGQKVELKKSTRKFHIQGGSILGEIKRKINELWPDNQELWIRTNANYSGMSRDTKCEPWQCGSINGNQYCHRIIKHKKECSNIFLPLDKEYLLGELMKNRFGVRVSRFSQKDIEHILKSEGYDPELEILKKIEKLGSKFSCG